MLEVAELKKRLKDLSKNKLNELLDEIEVSDAERKLFVKHYAYGKPLNVICGEINVSQQTAYNWHNKILKLLIKNIEEL